MRCTARATLDNTSYCRLTTVAGPEHISLHRTLSPPDHRPCLKSSKCFKVLNHLVSHKGKHCQSWRCHATLADVLAFVPGVCFDRQCQEAADRAFLIVTTVPLLGLLTAIILKLRPASPEELNSEQVFDDPATGVYFQSPDGTVPERDRKGELAFRPVSYTPWPVEAGTPGERLRVDVGPTSSTSPRTFVFDRSLGVSSDIVKVSLPRPMGLVFEEDKARGQVVVADFVQGSQAEKLSKVAKLNQSSRTAPQVGDVLRGCTCTNLVYPTKSLFGIQAPVRTIVMYGADNQKWPKVIAALKAGARSDGDVTLVLERKST